MHGSKYSEFDLKSSWYQNLFGEMLELTKRKGLILEINTKSLTERGITFPDKHFYQQILDLEIPITVNSDCHYPSRVIDGFQATYTQLKALGFKHLYQIENGNFQPVEFDETGIKW
jgi:histidinol-phosphatase (PHP family)